MKVLFLTTVGFLMIMFDLLLIPGSIFLVAGSIVILYSIYLNFVTFGPLWAGVHFLICLAIAPILILWSLRRVSLKEEMRAEDGFVGVDTFVAAVGKSGRALSPLHPSGSVSVVIDGEERVFDCISDGGFIEEQTPVEVVENRGGYLVVRELTESRASPSELEAQG